MGEAPDARPVRIQKNDRVVLVRNGIPPGGGSTTYYVCTGRWWARASAQQALIEAKRRGARELDDVVSLLGSLVSADLGSGNTGPPSVLP